MLKKTFALLLLSFAFSAAYGQVLVKTITLRPEEASEYCAEHGVTFGNKPNGLIYRLREEVTFPDLPRSKDVEDKLLFITDKAGDGYVALFRNTLGAKSYFFHVLTYNKKRKITGEYDLCELADNHYCEVQDIRWYDNHLYFNMACPSYSDGIGGRGSRLYSLNLETGEIEWCTQYLVSNDVFVVDDDYVYCQYGFTDEPDFVYLIDRKNGRTVNRCPIWTKGEYMEIIGDHEVYVQDYSEWGYVFKVESAGVRVTGEGVRLRTGPTTSAPYLKYADGITVSPIKGDILPTWGEEGEFLKVLWNNTNFVYISRLYSTTEVVESHNSCDRPLAGIRAWLGAEDDVVHFEIYDMEKFCKTAGVDIEYNSLKSGVVYNVSIDSPLACGVTIESCFDHLGLYIMSEDCRIFGVSLNDSAAGHPIIAREFNKDVLGEDFAVVDVTTGTVKDEWGNNCKAVWAVDFEGLRSQNVLKFNPEDWDMDEPQESDYSEEEQMGPLHRHYDIYGALLDANGKSTNMEVSFETSSQGFAAGSITYRPGGRTSVIRLSGTVKEDPNDNRRYVAKLTEYLDDGTACGELTLILTRQNVVAGSWKMNDKNLFLVIDEQGSRDL